MRGRQSVRVGARALDLEGRVRRRPQGPQTAHGRRLRACHEHEEVPLQGVVEGSDGGPQGLDDGDVARVPCAPGRGGGVRVGSVRGGVGSAVRSCAGALGGAARRFVATFRRRRVAGVVDDTRLRHSSKQRLAARVARVRVRRALDVGGHVVIDRRRRRVVSTTNSLAEPFIGTDVLERRPIQGRLVALHHDPQLLGLHDPFNGRLAQHAPEALREAVKLDAHRLLQPVVT